MPVSHVLLNQQLKGLDAYLVQGYENTLAKATLATAWAAQLRVSEYSSKLVVDVHSGDNHNLKQNNVLVQTDGLTVIFASDKTSSQCKERFIAWADMPIEGFQQLMEQYNKIRIKSSPVFFCHEDGTNLTPNDIANWIELSTSQTDWWGLKITSHCYRIGGTSYLYRSGLDIPNIQHSGRWSLGEMSAVEHYLKPGLYSTSPQTIRDTLPQYKTTMSFARALYLRDIITTEGGSDHPFNLVLKSLGFTKLQHSNYPTLRSLKNVRTKQSAALAMQFLQTYTALKVQKAREQSWRAATVTKLRAQVKLWCKNYPSSYGFFTDIRQRDQCHFCCTIECRSRSAEAKIQSLSAEISNQKHLACNLQETKSKLLLMDSQAASLNCKIAQQDCKLKLQKSQIHALKETIDVLTRENDTLQKAHGRQFSRGKCHKQTRTSRPGEDIFAEGVHMYPSQSIIDDITRSKDAHVTQKYIDPNGESRWLLLVKLKLNMYAAICRRLSKRFQIRRLYTQGHGSKVDWIAILKNQRSTRSM